MAFASGSSESRVRLAYARIAEVDRPEVWITLRPEDEVLADAIVIDRKVAAGEDLPLAGCIVAVKDNIDVAVLPTTAGCPAFSYDARDDAVAVELLIRAGAVVIGKTNLDQFATGLVGTRTPYGAVRDSRLPDRISGGSSSGSAVAVALGLVDVGLGTDTAGSGRVPAALQGIVGVKPTRGCISVTGVVPAAPGLDCVSVFAGDMSTARRVIEVLTAPDDDDPYSRGWPADAPAGAPIAARIGVARPADLEILSPAYRRAYERAIAQLTDLGCTAIEVDIAPFLDSSSLLYGGAFVAHRYAAVGAFIDAHPDQVDPSVASVIGGSRDLKAFELAADEHRLAILAVTVRKTFRTIDALVLPTTTEHPSLADVEAEPIAVNAKLGLFTNFCNLLDLCAVSVPAGEADGGQFGVTFFGPAFHDQVVGDIAARFLGQPGDSDQPNHQAIPLAVFGAHLRGQPLNGQLVGGRFLRNITTAAGYELFALPTTPAKPGLVRTTGGGSSIAGELWLVPPATLAGLLAAVGSPLCFGRVELSDGSTVVGFLCESAGRENAVNITEYGSWTNYLRADETARSLVEATDDVVANDASELAGALEVDGVPTSLY